MPTFPDVICTVDNCPAVTVEAITVGTLVVVETKLPAVKLLCAKLSTVEPAVTTTEPTVICTEDTLSPAKELPTKLPNVPFSAISPPVVMFVLTTTDGAVTFVETRLTAVPFRKTTSPTVEIEETTLALLTVDPTRALDTTPLAITLPNVACEMIPLPTVAVVVVIDAVDTPLLTYILPNVPDVKLVFPVDKELVRILGTVKLTAETLVITVVDATAFPFVTTFATKFAIVVMGCALFVALIVPALSEPVTTSPPVVTVFL